MADGCVSHDTELAVVVVRAPEIGGHEWLAIIFSQFVPFERMGMFYPAIGDPKVWLGATRIRY
jgi:hypothetical protein